MKKSIYLIEILQPYFNTESIEILELEALNEIDAKIIANNFNFKVLSVKEKIENLFNN